MTRPIAPVFYLNSRLPRRGTGRLSDHVRRLDGEGRGHEDRRGGVESCSRWGDPTQGSVVIILAADTSNIGCRCRIASLGVLSTDSNG